MSAESDTLRSYSLTKRPDGTRLDLRGYAGTNPQTRVCVDCKGPYQPTSGVQKRCAPCRKGARKS